MTGTVSACTIGILQRQRIEEGKKEEAEPAWVMSSCWVLFLLSIFVSLLVLRAGNGGCRVDAVCLSLALSIKEGKTVQREVNREG